MARILDGKAVAKDIYQDMAAYSATLQEAGMKPCLACIQTGKQPDIMAYAKSICRAATGLVEVKAFYPKTQGEAEDTLLQINGDTEIHGCLLLRPCGDGFDEEVLLDMLAPEKDVDGATAASAAAVFESRSQDAGFGHDLRGGVALRAGFFPATPEACIRILDSYGIEIAGRHALVIGRSQVVGKPLSMMLLARDATVTICHSKTANLPALSRDADIVICACGKARIFGEEYFSSGQTVIDCGIDQDASGAICGDVDFDAVEPIVGAITPVPNGVGSVTTAVMLDHVISASMKARANGGC